MNSASWASYQAAAEVSDGDYPEPPIECCHCLELRADERLTVTLKGPRGEEKFVLCGRCHDQLSIWLGVEHEPSYPEPDSEECNPDEY